MAYVIAEPCAGTKDTACVAACLLDCIHPKKNATHGDSRPSLNEVSQLYIDISRWMRYQRSAVLRRKSTTQDRRIRDRSMLTRSSRGARIHL